MITDFMFRVKLLIEEFYTESALYVGIYGRKRPVHS